MEPAAGHHVTPNVRLEKPLGRGGMGSVWLARNETLDAEVAVKFIAAEHVKRESSLERFRREASLAAKIKSPHVVTIFDHGITDDGLPYIVMERLHGESLAERLTRDQRLEPEEVVRLVSQVAKVLAEAHDAGVVHRDLKPANLFLLEGEELFVKVLDFGIAKETGSEKPSELTTTGTMVGTPYFMSPEMLLSTKEVDHRADLWALAVVAYMALTGRVPFDGETLAALTVAIHEGAFEAPSTYDPDLGEAVDDFFRVALCRTLDDRPRSADTFADDLYEALLGEPRRSVVSAKEQTPPEAEPAVSDETLAFGDTVPSSDDVAGDDEDRGAAPGHRALESSTLGGSTGSSRRERRFTPWLLVVPLLVGGLFLATRGEDPRGEASSAPASAGPTLPASPATSEAPSPEAPTGEPEPPPSASSPPSEPSTPPPPAEPATSPSPPPPRPRPVVLPSPPPRPPATPPPPPPPEPKPKPADCSDPFRINAQGDLVPRPECF